MTQWFTNDLDCSGEKSQLGGRLDEPGSTLAHWESMKPFRSTKSIWLGIAGAVVLFGFLAYAVFMPYLATPYGSDAPDVDVPRMRNVPDSSEPGNVRAS